MKGISPIVAVVLLIAIAVIAAVGLYFWVGSLTGKQATPSTPGMLTAQAICADTSDGTTTVLITNIGSSNIDISNLQATFSSDTNAAFSTTSCDTTSLAPGQTAKCNITNFGTGSGTATFYGNNIGSFSIHC